MGVPEMIEQRNRIMIFGPKSDGSYVIEFRTAAGEVRAPWRTVPRAAFLALAAATALYLAIQWVALGIEGTRLGAETVTPLAQAAAVFGGAPGRTLIGLPAGRAGSARAF